jgi:hypothetical protein
LIVALFLAKNDNRTDEMSTIVLNLPNDISICSFNNPDTILYHSLLLFHRHPPLNMKMFKFFVVFILHNLILHPFHLHMI